MQRKVERELQVDEVEKPIQIRAPEDPTGGDRGARGDRPCVQYRSWCRRCIAGRAVCSRRDGAVFAKLAHKRGAVHQAASRRTQVPSRGPTGHNKLEGVFVFVVKGPMCRWQMVATDKRGLQGAGYVRKETGWMTKREPWRVFAQMRRAKWLDTNKGDPTNPNYRCRLVVRGTIASELAF